MTRLHPDVAAELEAGKDQVDVIVMTDDVDALLADLPPGCQVRHVYHLRKGLSARATADAVRTLSGSKLVRSIEPDSPVQAHGA